MKGSFVRLLNQGYSMFDLGSQQSQDCPGHPAVSELSTRLATNGS